MKSENAGRGQKAEGRRQKAEGRGQEINPYRHPEFISGSQRFRAQGTGLKAHGSGLNYSVYFAEAT